MLIVFESAHGFYFSIPKKDDHNLTLVKVAEADASSSLHKIQSTNYLNLTSSEEVIGNLKKSIKSR